VEPARFRGSEVALTEGGELVGGDSRRILDGDGEVGESRAEGAVADAGARARGLPRPR
jgi:hypothetical protein